VLRQSGELSALGGVSGAGTIGEGINHTFFNGEISEILVYNRVLSEDESAAVEHYLAQNTGCISFHTCPSHAKPVLKGL
jgi:hypothetical protein